MIFPKRPEAYHVLQPFLDKAAQEEKASGVASRATLLDVAEQLVLYAPNLYTAPNAPSYSQDEATAAKALLKKYGLERFGNCSPRYKKATLALIEAERDV